MHPAWLHSFQNNRHRRHEDASGGIQGIVIHQIWHIHIKYPRPAVTADSIVITREQGPKVLLIQRGNPPFKGGWAFPGGFMNMDETTEQCAIRELEEETGLRVAKVHQIGAYSKVDRDPRGRTVTVAYLAIVEEPMAVGGQDDAAKAEWWSLSDLPHLAFDHYDIIQDAIRLYYQLLKI